MLSCNNNNYIEFKPVKCDINGEYFKDSLHFEDFREY